MGRLPEEEYIRHHTRRILLNIVLFMGVYV